MNLSKCFNVSEMLSLLSSFYPLCLFYTLSYISAAIMTKLLISSYYSEEKADSQDELHEDPDVGDLITSEAGSDSLPVLQSNLNSGQVLPNEIDISDPKQLTEIAK